MTAGSLTDPRANFFAVRSAPPALAPVPAPAPAGAFCTAPDSTPAQPPGISREETPSAVGGRENRTILRKTSGLRPDRPVLAAKTGRFFERPLGLRPDRPVLTAKTGRFFERPLVFGQIVRFSVPPCARNFTSREAQPSTASTAQGSRALALRGCGRGGRLGRRLVAGSRYKLGNCHLLPS